MAHEKSVSKSVRLVFLCLVEGLSGGITPVTPLVEGDGTDKAGTWWNKIIAGTAIY